MNIARRRAIVSIPTDDVVKVFTVGGPYTIDNIPSEYQVISVHHNWRSHAFEIVIQSEDLPEIEDRASLPLLEAELTFKPATTEMEELV